MALTREQKEQTVADATEALSGALSYVFVAYDALSVADVEDLRQKMDAEDVSLRVLPKRLLRIVLQNLELPFDPTEAEGQLAVAWSNDPVAPARILDEFIQNHDNLRLVAGAMEGSLLSFEEVQALAKLPSREQLLGQLVGTLAAPMSGAVRVLSGVQRSAVYVLTAIKEQKESNS